MLAAEAVVWLPGLRAAEGRTQSSIFIYELAIGHLHIASQ